MKHGPARYESIKRVLFVYAKLNPGVKYVQGMNELLGALFYVLAAQSPTESESEEMAEMFHPDTAEADAFNCFTVYVTTSCSLGTLSRLSHNVSLNIG